MAQTRSKTTHRFEPQTEGEKVAENCSRCGGMLVDDQCYNFSGSGIVRIEIKRCIQCGDVIDSVILQHRCHSSLSEAYTTCDVLT